MATSEQDPPLLPGFRVERVGGEWRLRCETCGMRWAIKDKRRPPARAELAAAAAAIRAAHEPSTD